jgi:hypothetical protein
MENKTLIISLILIFALMLLTAFLYPNNQKNNAIAILKQLDKINGVKNGN